MPRPVRTLAAVVAAVAAGGLLTGCGTKPSPNVTVLSGHTTSVVKPQTYCFDTNPAHCRVSAKGNVAAIKARQGSTIFVDVPRSVANSHWGVTSATENGSGQFQAITGSGLSSSTLHDRHSTRVNVPYGPGTKYYLIVIQQAGSVQTASWVTQVTITDS
jgi:hypothetical protein